MNIFYIKLGILLIGFIQAGLLPYFLTSTLGHPNQGFARIRPRTVLLFVCALGVLSQKVCKVQLSIFDLITTKNQDYALYTSSS